MGKEQDWKSLGEEILDSVSGALNSGDFSKLNTLVSGTVENAVREAKKQANFERITREEILRQYQQDNAARREKWLKQQQELYQRRNERREEWRRVREEAVRNNQAFSAKNGMVSNYIPPNANYGVKTTLPPPPRAIRVRFNKVGSVSNVLNTVFGAIGIGMGVAMSIMTMILLHSGDPAGLPFTLFTAAVLFVSGKLLGKGASQRNLLTQAQRYIQICGPKLYANIDDIAAQTGTPAKKVRKNIKKMLRAGMFPEGHLDSQESCLMLSNEVYRQYTETAEAYKMREQMEAERRERENRPKTFEEEQQEMLRQQEVELNAMMTEGMSYLQKLRELNEAIPGEEITAQLTKLDALLLQIFDRVKEHPEQMNRMSKLMEYYLPTTVKLVEAYVQFEKVEKPGQDIRDAKSEIKKTLGIINDAFE
ncbi:MAG: 5-bromo-4-chloroindolyl phosphate hydrolysis family protein [Lachnospiraceae bacterium]|nr:5-bromo-4-chloroindolyl phosphate hydrolysis family protein [Lachnospiraceae bacterium]